jgi:hypothetical protein
MLRAALIVIFLSGCYRYVKQTEGYCYQRDGNKQCFQQKAPCNTELTRIVEAAPWTRIEGNCSLSFPD